MTNKYLQYFDNQQFETSIIEWFQMNKRDLPWRNTKDPYKIWVSEIMLQQTKVDTVIPYYERFLKKFPTVFALAAAEEQAVLKMWEGLGYYSRARNLHAAAKQVVKDYNGIVPNTEGEISKLKGVGPYTRGAVLSIAYGLPSPAVDGNVMRVMSRVLGSTDNISEAKTKKNVEEMMRTIITDKNPSAFNQGLMEIGALVCTPKKPTCLHCPVREQCRALADGIVEELPVKGKQKKQKELDYYVLIVRDNKGNIGIEQRPSEGLLANMWQFPMVSKENIQMNQWIENPYNIAIRLTKEQGTIRHVFSHIIWNLHVYETFITDKEKETLPFTMVKEEELNDYPFSVSHMKVQEWI